MAFFGLTQLGAQSTFNVNLISLQNYSCFAEEDFRAAFEKQSGGAASVSLDKVGPMLEEVFGGFAPEQEMEALLATLQHFEGEITFDHIMTSVAAVAGAFRLCPTRVACRLGSSPSQRHAPGFLSQLSTIAAACLFILQAARLQRLRVTHLSRTGN